jgi:hypothetical protein
VTDVLQITDGGLWQVSYARKDRARWSRWRTVNSSNAPASALAVGDFDGNGTADVFRAEKGYWFVSYSTTDRTSHWSRWDTINRSHAPVSSLSFADVNGDGRTDAIFVAPVAP